MLIPSLRGSDLGMCTKPDEVARVALLFGLEALHLRSEAAEAQALAQSLLPEDRIATAEMFADVNEKAGGALYGFRQDRRITGVLAAFALNQKGLAAVQARAFDAIDVDLELLAKPGELPGAYYGWGFAASNHDAGRAVVKASAAIHRELYWATPTYARAVTKDGVRALTSIGFSTVPWGEQGMLWIAPRQLGMAR